MGSLSDYAELELLDHVFNVAYTPVATVYVGLSTADPLDSGSGLAEPVGNNYGRTAITFAAAGSRAIVQTGASTFPTASGPWGLLGWWAIFDNSAGGNMLAHGALGVAKNVVSGNTPSIASGEVDVTFSANEVSTVLANYLLDLMFRNTAYGKPDTYVALCTATIADGDTGSSITEPSGFGYARKQVNPNGGSSPTWDLAAAGLVDNTHDVVVGTASGGDWGTIVAVAVVSASSAGDLLFYDNAMADQAVSDGDTAQFPAGDLDATLD